jgi:hypothetical protein
VLIARNLCDAKLFTEQLANLLAKPASDDQKEATQDKLYFERKEENPKGAKEDVGLLTDFPKLLNPTCNDA